MSSLQSNTFRLRGEPPGDYQHGLTLVEGAREESYIEKYRPTTLGEVLGQDAIVSRLRRFLATPYSCPMLFVGPTGCGKTSTAFAMKHDMNIDPGNWFWIKSGGQDGKTVECVLEQFKFVPWGRGENWRIVLLDEADLMTDQAKKLWLSGLEFLPKRTILIFTTNNAERFDQRTLDRFGVPYKFEATGDSVKAAAQQLADSIWEVDGPDLAQLPNVIERGVISFRRVATAMQAAVRDGIIAPMPTGPPEAAAESPPPATPTCKATKPTPEPGTLAERRHLAAVKANATRKARAAGLIGPTGKFVYTPAS
jgi:replication factor C small subunit